jgi:hypothetical protein
MPSTTATTKGERSFSIAMGKNPLTAGVWGRGRKTDHSRPLPA